MFRGHFDHAIDAKGRTSFPSRFREILAAGGDLRIVMTMGLDACLEAWSIPEWTAFEGRVAALSQFDEAVVQLRRVYISSAVDCDVDKLGRVLIPQSLREHAGLAREVRWCGMGNKIELWDKAQFEVARKQMVAEPAGREELRRRLSGLGL